MKKDKTILELIEKLKLEINISLLEIVDYWEADLCAIGLKKQNRLLYISTFNYVEDKEVSYDFDLEIIDENNKDGLNVIKTGRKVSESELVNEIRLFLK